MIVNKIFFPENNYKRAVMRLLVFILAFCSQGLMASSLTDNSYQGVLIGDSPENALKKLENYMSGFDPDDEDTAYCYYLAPDDNKPGAYFMILDAHVARIDIFDERAGIKTRKGIGIGSTKEEVLSVYENVKISTHPYVGNKGEYLEIKLDNGNGLIFETYHDVVTSFRLGSYPAVEYIEGCS